MKSGALLASFAHLIPFGTGALAAKRVEDETDDEKKEREDKERDANKAATGHAETDDEREKREDAEARAAAGDDDDERCAEDDDERKGDDDEAKKAADAGHAKALAAARRAGSRAAKARIAQIMGAKVAGRNPALALRLALGKTPVAEAIAILGELPAPIAGVALVPRELTLAERMSATAQPTVGPDGGKPAAAPGSVSAAAEAMTAAYNKHSGAAAR